MGKKLAIRGHSTRGKEVIELLEMMGGKNIHKRDGEANAYSYYLYDNAILSDRLSIAEDDDFEIFTLEEFLNKFPFKVHDLVNIPEYESTVGICGMRWDKTCRDVEYLVYRCDDEEWYTTKELLEYNDNPNEIPKNKKEKKINQMSLANCDLDEVEIVLGDKFELKIEDGKYYAVRKKSKYPTTYVECCDVLNIPNDERYIDIDVPLDYNKLVSTFTELLICRKAYWKIAGEQMGLDKPWEPDLENEELYCVQNYNKQIIKSKTNTAFNKILIFPTEEMRDAFYKNFKKEIEHCKELL